MLKPKSLRKQACFKIQFHVGINLTWNICGLTFFILDFLPLVLFRRFWLKSEDLKMQIPQGRSAQIKKLKKTNLLLNSILHRNTTDLERFCDFGPFWPISASPNIESLFHEDLDP